MLRRIGTEELPSIPSGSPVFIQDEQPTYTGKYVWFQTNVNSNGDFTVWFCEES